MINRHPRDCLAFFFLPWHTFKGFSRYMTLLWPLLCLSFIFFLSSAASVLDNKVLRAAVEYAEAAAAPISHRLFSRYGWKDPLLGIWESWVSREIKKKKTRRLQKKIKWLQLSDPTERHCNYHGGGAGNYRKGEVLTVTRGVCRPAIELINREEIAIEVPFFFLLLTSLCTRCIRPIK